LDPNRFLYPPSPVMRKVFPALAGKSPNRNGFPHSDVSSFPFLPSCICSKTQGLPRVNAPPPQKPRRPEIALERKIFPPSRTPPPQPLPPPAFASLRIMKFSADSYCLNYVTRAKSCFFWMSSPFGFPFPRICDLLFPRPSLL